ncbi:MAG: PocR ligand-binding domain-containing protein [Candidatus Omnitrophica bacterium]|nr:PocR ligand-binding domain-containing protein [Candidatus Omnitrophota bacterium]
MSKKKDLARTDKTASSANLPEIDIDAVINPSITLKQMISLFYDSTGLDLFLVFEDESDEWKEKELSHELNRPQFCQLLHQSSKGVDLCRSSHKTMSSRTISSNQPICQHCHAGLITIHYPVSLRNDGIGDFQTTCAIEYGNRKQFEKKISELSSLYNLPSESLEDSLHNLKVVSRRKVESIIQWMEMIVNYLCESSQSNLEQDSAFTSGEAGEKKIIRCSSVEYMIRSYIGPSTPLPAWRSGRCAGASRDLIEHVMKFIQCNYGLRLSTQVVAQALGFETNYFSHVFKQYGRQSFLTYLKQIRLENAKALLDHPHKTIVDISQQCGFSDAAYFSNVFKETFGVSPSALRSGK